MSIEESVHRYLGAYEDDDRAMIESVLSQELVFTSPQDDHIDYGAYFTRCWPNARDMRKVNIEKIFAEDGEAFVQYQIEMHSGKRFRNVEFLKFNGPKICAITVYFGRALGWGEE
jgi:hypothetical protein